MKNTNQQQALAGQKIVLMGASSGIGLATAKAAAAEGAQVIIVSGNQQRLEKALSELPENSTAHAVDLSKEEHIKDLFSRIGNFDHLVFTAGENISLSPIGDTSVAAARDFFNLRFWGAFTAVKYAAPLISKQGSVSLISGIASQRPGSGWSVAASICSAIEGFVRAMAVELAPVRVNSVMPGVIRTNLWNSLSDMDREGLYRSVGETIPVKRVGEAEDVAQAFLYLIKQSFGTGQNIIVDGGTVLV